MNLFTPNTTTRWLERVHRNEDVQSLKNDMSQLTHDYEELRAQYNELVNKYNNKIDAKIALHNDMQAVSVQLSNAQFLSNKFQNHVKSVTDPVEGLTRFAELQVMNIARVLISKLAPDFLDKNTVDIPVDIKKNINIKMLTYATAWYENLARSQDYYDFAYDKLEIASSGAPDPVKIVKEAMELIEKGNALKTHTWPGTYYSGQGRFRDMKEVLVSGERDIKEMFNENLLAHEGDTAKIVSVSFAKKEYEFKRNVYKCLDENFGFITSHMLT